MCKAFREKGHRAFSCDIQECSGGHPEWHIQGDCLPLLNGNCEFWTRDKDGRGVGWHTINGKWDLIIAHPPCTYLTLAGNKWFKPEYKDRFPDRERERASRGVLHAVRQRRLRPHSHRKPCVHHVKQMEKARPVHRAVLFRRAGEEENGAVAKRITSPATDKHRRADYRTLCEWC